MLKRSGRPTRCIELISRSTAFASRLGTITTQVLKGTEDNMGLSAIQGFNKIVRINEV